MTCKGAGCGFELAIQPSPAQAAAHTRGLKSMHITRESPPVQHSPVRYRGKLGAVWNAAQQRAHDEKRLMQLGFSRTGSLRRLARPMGGWQPCVAHNVSHMTE